MIKRNAFIILVNILLIFTILFPTTIYAQSLDDTFKGADDFVKKGSNTTIDTNQLQTTSNFIYNAVLAIAIVAVVIVGLVLGIKYMTAASEDKAEVKETLIPYVVSCVVIFGAFTIWKIVINVLQ